MHQQQDSVRESDSGTIRIRKVASPGSVMCCFESTAVTELWCPEPEEGSDPDVLVFAYVF